MDNARFDALAKAIGQRSSRRQLLRGLLGLGGAAAAATITTRGADAQWSALVCLPNGSGGYTSRLIPKSSVPLYQRQYGAILAQGGACPACQAGFKTCNGGCIPASTCCTDSDCTPPQTCQDGTCVCLPNCADKQCGDDGCGGTCGTCTGNTVCEVDTCVECPPFTTPNQAGVCVHPCTLSSCSCGVSDCAATPNGSAICLGSSEWICAYACTSDDDCTGGTTCLRRQFPDCTTGVGACGTYTLCS